MIVEKRAHSSLYLSNPHFHTFRIQSLDKLSCPFLAKATEHTPIEHSESPNLNLLPTPLSLSMIYLPFRRSPPSQVTAARALSPPFPKRPAAWISISRPSSASGAGPGADTSQHNTAAAAAGVAVTIQRVSNETKQTTAQDTRFLTREDRPRLGLRRLQRHDPTKP